MNILLKTMKTLFSVVLLLFVFSFINCDGDDGPTTPANLEVSLAIEGDFNNRVNLQATADNTNFFRFDYGDGAAVVENTHGNAIYTYPESGTYTITIQAHSTETEFISATEVVTINIPDPTETGYESPLTYDGYTLVWQDEFTTEISDAWTFEIGDGCPNICGWGNNELEYYREENATIEDGHLVITAKNENFGGKQYTSTRMITKGNKEFRYGRIDIRAILPKGQGIWPALWMLGSNIDDVGWPKCGEIDIMEMIGGSGREQTVHGTTHWDNAGSHAQYGGSTTLASGTFGDSWHVFSIIWDEEKIVWLLDDEQFHVIDTTPAGLSEFHEDFFLIFNVAVGGNWPGNPDGNTVFPQKMLVDYVRVFQPE